MKIKNVLLKDFNVNRDVAPFQPNKDIEIKWQQTDNNQTYASIIGNNKQEINKQLSTLNNKIVSERCRTLNNLPKWRIINTTKRRIY